MSQELARQLLNQGINPKQLLQMAYTQREGTSPTTLKRKPKGLAREADKVKAAGRYGDDMLVHMNKDELKRFSEMLGVAPTVNPETGQPEFWLSDFGDFLGDMASDMFNEFTSVMSDPFTSMVANVLLPGSGLLGALSSAGGSVLSSLGLGNMSSIFSNLGNFGNMSGALSSLGSLFSGAGDGLSNALSGAGDGFSNALSGAGEGLSNVLSEAGNGVEDLWSSLTTAGGGGGDTLLDGFGTGNRLGDLVGGADSLDTDIKAYFDSLDSLDPASLGAGALSTAAQNGGPLASTNDYAFDNLLDTKLKTSMDPLSTPIPESMGSAILQKSSPLGSVNESAKKTALSAMLKSNAKQDDSLFSWQNALKLGGGLLLSNMMSPKQPPGAPNTPGQAAAVNNSFSSIDSSPLRKQTLTRTQNQMPLPGTPEYAAMLDRIKKGQRLKYLTDVMSEAT